MSYSKHLPDSSWRVLNLSVRSTAVMRRATHIIHDCKSEERDSAMLNPHVTTVEAERDSYYFVYNPHKLDMSGSRQMERYRWLHPCAIRHNKRADQIVSLTHLHNAICREYRSCGNCLAWNNNCTLQISTFYQNDNSSISSKFWL